MKYAPTSAHLEQLGITPDQDQDQGSVRNSDRYAIPHDGGPPSAAVEPFRRRRPRFYHRILKGLHKPHHWVLEPMVEVNESGEPTRDGLKRGNVIALCEPAGCGSIRFMHPFARADEESADLSKRARADLIPPTIAPMRSETAVAWAQATGRAS